MIDACNLSALANVALGELVKELLLDDGSNKLCLVHASVSLTHTAATDCNRTDDCLRSGTGVVMVLAHDFVVFVHKDSIT